MRDRPAGRSVGGGRRASIDSQIDAELRLGQEERDPRRARGAGQRRVLGPAAAAPAAGGQPQPGRRRWAPTTSSGSPWTPRVSRTCARSAPPSASRGTRSTSAYDVATVAAEVNEFNWFNDSKADGGSGICAGQQDDDVPQAAEPEDRLDLLHRARPGPDRLHAVLNNDPRPFFMHQSNLTGDRLAYPVMDGVLSAYRAVFGSSAPIVQPADVRGRGGPAQPAALGQRRCGGHWSPPGCRATRSRSPGRRAPRCRSRSRPGPGGHGGPSASPTLSEVSGYTTLGSQPLKLTLASAPFSG